MFKIIFILIFIVSACQNSYGADVEAVIHPKAFENIESWISDTESPLYLSFNVDAVRKNRNQFDYSQVTVTGNLVNFTRENGYLAYKIVSNTDHTLQIIFYNNGGGTLTTATDMTFAKVTKSILVHGQSQTIKLLELIELSSVQ